MTNDVMAAPEILSLDEHSVKFSDEVSSYLESQFLSLYNGDADKAADHFKNILQDMKTPPSVSTCRINLIKNDLDQCLRDIRKLLETRKWTSSQTNHTTTVSSKDGNLNAVPIFQANKHPLFDDVIEIRLNEAFIHLKPLREFRIPPNNFNITSASASASASTLQQKIERMEHHEWPRDHKVIICDIFCGEAVLRGSNIFVKGIICADRGIEPGMKVAVYANVKFDKNANVTKGMYPDDYFGQCIFLGIGIARCSRAQMFNLDHGIGVEMCVVSESIQNENVHENTCTRTSEFFMKAVTPQPPLNDCLVGKMMLQNIPSILVAHALDPRPKDVIADMCAAPGGKTSHVASLVRNDATIIAMDKSRKKVLKMKSLFGTMGATCITPLALDSTKCLLSLDFDSDDDNNNNNNSNRRKDVIDILSSSQRSDDDGLIEVQGFYPESFDRIVLDPPCSALGLRPKLKIPFTRLKELKKHHEYAKRFIGNAVALLKLKGTLTFSTCTINSSENEEMVRYILDTYPSMELLPIDYNIGLAGLPGHGLNDDERGMVRRFDPSDAADTPGFFVAKFVKRRL